MRNRACFLYLVIPVLPPPTDTHHDHTHTHTRTVDTHFSYPAAVVVLSALVS